MDAERTRRQRESSYQRRRRQDRSIQVKLGHGGTLDPLATGVLIVGIGRGTKQLQQFLECTKCYDTTLLFGVATDTYDVTGRSLAVSDVDDLSQDKVKAALDGFRGSIMQRPPIFSALRVHGKRLYEYAREGLELPVEIKERPVTVKDLSITEWLPSEAHDFRLPVHKAEEQDIKLAKDVLGISDALLDSSHIDSKLTVSDTQIVPDAPCNTSVTEDLVGLESSTTVPLESQLGRENSKTASGSPSIGLDKETTSQPARHTFELPAKLPAANLRMTVTSGFYVRSLCHDLGRAVGCLGVMAALRRTRQGRFELGKNVLAYEDFTKGEDCWGPKLRALLEDWDQSQSL